jgi:modulator of FtsH protease HflK
VHRRFDFQADDHHHHHDHNHGRRPWAWLNLLPWLAVIYLATGFYAVQPNEQVIVRRCGRMLPEVMLPGLHFGFPYGIDQETHVKSNELKRVGIGASLLARSLGRTGEPQLSEYLTGDRNLIVVSAIVQYRIAPGQQGPYLFHTYDVGALVADVASARLAEIVSSMKVDDILTVERIAIQDHVLEAAQKALDRCQAGVQLSTVTLEGAAPPQEVAEAFRDVSAAREDRQRTINEAQGYANRILPQARGEAQRVRVEADGYRSEVVTKAQGDAARFSQMAAEVASNRPLTFRRLILETMEEVLPRLTKVVVDPNARQGLDLGLIEATP